VGNETSYLGGIPDPSIPGYESTNGSLGHGLGIAGGVGLYLKRKYDNKSPRVYVLISDGELYEGSTWEAAMLIGALQLDNLTLIIDYNKKTMLGATEEIIPLGNLAERFSLMGWNAIEVDGHDNQQIFNAYISAAEQNKIPNVIVANTIKGKGVKSLENDPLSHIANLSGDQVEAAKLEILSMGKELPALNSTNSNNSFDRSIY